MKSAQPAEKITAAADARLQHIHITIVIDIYDLNSPEVTAV
jgi:hypothetical protein